MVWGKGTEPPLSPGVHVFTNPKALWTAPSFWIFMEASLLRHDTIGHWSVISISSLPPLPRGGFGAGLGAKIPTF